MRSIGGGSRIAVLAAIVLAAALAHAEAQTSVSEGPAAAASSSAGPEPFARFGRSAAAVEAELAISRTGIASDLEAALGDAFGGLWFEPSTAQLHVGVTSADGTREAAAAAARAGVAEIVTPTPVRSSWAELEAAQQRWNERLADLYAEARVQTALLADRNAVEVLLGSAVAPARRVALEAAAARAAVDVTIVAARSPSLEATQSAQCAAFKKKEAHCDPTIVAGVSAADEVTMNEGRCTAGPTVMRKAAKTRDEATETFLLTAGHCITGEGKVHKNWYAYEKVPNGRKEIGEAEAGIYGTAGEAKVDIGVIGIDQTTWAKAENPIPVSPKIAAWDLLQESEPFTVIKSDEPIQGRLTCFSGQRSGTLCGEVVKTGVKWVTKDKDGKVIAEVEGNVEVKLSAGKVGHGDSGAPAFSWAPWEQKNEGVVEGIVVAHLGSGDEAAQYYMQPLTPALEALENKKDLYLKLLVQGHEKRKHPKFKAAKYPAAVRAEDASSAEEFTAFGSYLKCTERKFEGVLAEHSFMLELTPTYGGCTMGGAWPVVVTGNGCEYRLDLEVEVAASHYDAGLGVVCPEGKPGIQLHVYSTHADRTAAKAMCTLTVPPQEGLGPVTLTNSGSGVLVDGSSLSGLDVKVASASCACPGEAAEAETGNGAFDLDGGLTLTASSLGEAVDFEIEAE